MPARRGTGKERRNVRFYLWAAGVFVADQLTKLLAVHLLHPLEPVRVIPAFFRLIIKYNSGAAFSLFQDHPIILTIFTSLASALIIWWGVTLPKTEKLMQTALGLLAGGAVGNLFDRLVRGGLVVDFLDLHWFNRIHWPTFNLADTAICTGVALVLIDAFRKSRRQKS